MYRENGTSKEIKHGQLAAFFFFYKSKQTKQTSRMPLQVENKIHLHAVKVKILMH